jgi:DNA-binding MarR family transcriptional regulator
MADFSPRVNPLFLREEDLRQGIDLLFHAYRDFSEEVDEVLARHGLGRAHYRAVHFVGRHPAIGVGDLLAILRITKQSLSRVLGHLVREGYISQRPGTRDRRQRLLTLTAAGAALDHELLERQQTYLARAYRAAGAEAVEGFRKVLLGMVRDNDRVDLEPHPPAPV